MVSVEDLSVVFQPIVELENASVFAYEALVRCSRPDLASPPVLFERAVSAGCVGRLGRMIREIAIPLASGRPLFLNVHPQELQEGWLVRPDDPIYLHDDSVYLEITESVPLTHYELCIDVLKDVRARTGLHLVVDDLGAGYSNLKRIADLEPKVVKLDRGLVCGIERSVRQQQLVASVVRLCMDLDAVVVAEGIETEAELLALTDTGTHYGQGYLFARPEYPMPAVTWPPGAPRRSIIERTANDPRSTVEPKSAVGPKLTLEQKVVIEQKSSLEQKSSIERRLTLDPRRGPTPPFGSPTEGRPSHPASGSSKGSGNPPMRAAGPKAPLELDLDELIGHAEAG